MRTKVVFVLPSLVAGGAERVALTLLRNLSRERFDPHLVLFSCSGTMKDEITSDVGITVLGRDRLRSVVPSLFLVLRRLRPDIVYSTLHHTNIATLAISRLLRSVRVVVRESNSPSAALPVLRYGSVITGAYRLLYPLADRIVCQSEEIRKELSRDFRVSDNRLALLPNPVDEDRIRRLALPSLRVRGVGLRLVAVGSLTRQKGIDRLIDLVPGMPPDTHLTIVGEGPERPCLERQVASLKQEDRVTLVGFHAAPWRYMSGADALLLPSRWEGLPNVGLEALACGIPVVATPECGGFDEVARLAPPGAVCLAEMGEQFLGAVSRLDQRRPGAGASLLPERYGLETAIKGFEQILVSVVTSSP